MYMMYTVIFSRTFFYLTFNTRVMLYVLQNLFPLLEGSDFVLPEVVFHPDQTLVTVDVLIIDDEISEEVENFTIRGNIVAPDHGLVEVTGSVTIEIIDDDCELKCDCLI